MTPRPGPTDELRAAAAKLRTHVLPDGGCYCGYPDRRIAYPLVDWLEAEAAHHDAVGLVREEIQRHAKTWIEADASTLPQALAVARAINGPHTDRRTA